MTSLLQRRTQTLTVLFLLGSMGCGTRIVALTAQGVRSPQVADRAVSLDMDDGEFDLNGPTWLPQGEAGNVTYFGNWNVETTWAYFRFQLGGSIPSGAVVDHVYLELWGADSTFWDPTLWLEISADRSNDSAAVSTVNDYPGGPSGHAQTSAVIRWPAAGGLIWNTNTWNRTPDLSPVLQEVIDTAGGITAGHHLQFWISGANIGRSNEVGTEDFSSGGGHAATLHVEWH